MKSMRGILINPIDRSITEVEHNGDYRQIYDIIQADIFERVAWDRKNNVWIDEMGFLREPPKPLFQIPSYPKPLCGLGLILGETMDRADNCSTTLSLEHVRAAVIWPKVRFTGITYDEKPGSLEIITNFEPTE